MTHLKKEIFEQPQILAGLLGKQRRKAEEIATAINQRNIDYVFLAARGTSDNAGVYANYLWGSHNRLPVALATPSLFTIYQQPPKLQNSLVVGISQSGKSPDIVSVIEEGRRENNLALVITNAPESPLAQQATHVFDVLAGDELAVAATKSYTAQLMAIAMISAALSDSTERWNELAQIPDWVAAALKENDVIQNQIQRYRYMDQCVVLGRGFNYATVFEWALKIKELIYIVAEPYSSADFLHGPIALVNPGFPILAVAPSGKVFPGMLDSLKNLRENKRAELVVISDQEEALNLAQTRVRLPSGIPEWLTPIVTIVLAQLFTYHLTIVLGNNPDFPRGLSKVTETE